MSLADYVAFAISVVVAVGACVVYVDFFRTRRRRAKPPVTLGKRKPPTS